MMILYLIFISLCYKKETIMPIILRDMANHYTDGASPQMAFRISFIIAGSSRERAGRER